MTEPFAAAHGLVRVYPATGTADSAGAGLVWAHGGGFVHGDLDMPEAHWVARAFAARGVAVVSIDYRLVRDGANTFPAASDDVLAAWTWTLDHADELGLDPARLAIGGASAGANLVTGAVLRMLGHGSPRWSGGAAGGDTPRWSSSAAGGDTPRWSSSAAGGDTPRWSSSAAGGDTPRWSSSAAGGDTPRWSSSAAGGDAYRDLATGLDTAASLPTRPPEAASRPMLPAGVFLAYPTLLAVQPAPDPALRAALDANPDADRFGPEAVRSMYETYLGGTVAHAPIAAVPGLATPADLVGFPPTLMVNGDVDELRVSGEAFAATLAEAGVPIELALEPGTVHGHLNRPDEPGASATVARVAEWIAGLETRPASPGAPRPPETASDHQTTRITEGITS
ncbi:alpha/beta hydrolase [Agromyces sp. MMS24-JH15]|uniref:alpha/beta hydrolase n=1 Tax=Agromyces sp. MMS24-JH15 TaxID=3243765 RepID=UPI003749A6EC